MVGWISPSGAKCRHKPRLVEELAEELKKPKYSTPELSEERKQEIIRRIYGKLLYSGTEVPPEPERADTSFNGWDLLKMMHQLELAENDRIFGKTEW